MSDTTKYEIITITPKHDYELEAYVYLPVGTKDEVVEDMRMLVGEEEYKLTSSVLDIEDDWKRYNITIKGYEMYNAFVWYNGDEFDE